MLVLLQLDYQSVVALLFLLFCPPLFSTTLMQGDPRFPIDFYTFLELVLTGSMNAVLIVSTTIWRS